MSWAALIQIIAYFISTNFIAKIENWVFEFLTLLPDGKLSLEQPLGTAEAAEKDGSLEGDPGQAGASVGTSK